jgi:2-isopropylmalate synthase
MCQEKNPLEFDLWFIAFRVSFLPRIEYDVNSSRNPGPVEKMTYDKSEREEVIRIAARPVARAKRYTPNVEFTAMDATRSDVEFLLAVAVIGFQLFLIQ